MPRPLRHYVIPAGGEFGAVRAGGARTHHGADYHPLDNKDGEPIYGTGPGGVVTYIGYDPDPTIGAGHNVTVFYRDQNRTTRDCHMREATTLWVGSTVGTTTRIGYVGHTGNAVNAQPAGSHDHHEVRIGGVLVDPEKFYSAEPATAGTPIVDQEEEAMSDQIRYLHRIETPTPEWGIYGASLQPNGYEVTTDVKVAEVWGAVYGTPDGDSWKGLTRPQWIELQKQMKIRAAAWKADRVAIAKAAAPQFDYAKLAALFAAAIPKAPAETIPSIFPKGFTGQFLTE